MLATLLCVVSIAQLPVADIALAKRYFQEARWACDDDAGKMWGRSLWGPMILADPTTRQAFASESVIGFEEKDGVWAGKLPASVGIANTSLDWSGKKWTMVMWPLPENRGERVRLMTHELYHHIQDDLKLPANSPQNAHLDTQDGRLWLQVEGRALAKALLATDDSRDVAIKDALCFRAKRQSLFQTAKTEEDALELNEGLAEYTGFMMKGAWEPESRIWVGRQIETGFFNRTSYSRSFAYRTGPAYCFLLNLKEALLHDSSTWRSKLKEGDSLADALASMVGFKPTVDNVESRAMAYGYEALKKQEDDRETQRKAREAEFFARFVDGPVLVVALEGANFQFNPNDVFPLGTHGTIYRNCTVIDEWGSLSGPEGILISPDFKTATVSAPASANERKGTGWSIELKSGWVIKPGPRKGDFTVSKS